MSLLLTDMESSFSPRVVVRCPTDAILEVSYSTLSIPHKPAEPETGRVEASAAFDYL